MDGKKQTENDEGKTKGKMKNQFRLKRFSPSLPFFASLPPLLSVVVLFWREKFILIELHQKNKYMIA